MAGLSQQAEAALVEIRAELERTIRDKSRAFDTWVRLVIGSHEERVARAGLDAFDLRIERLELRLARLEHEAQGERWLRPV